MENPYRVLMLEDNPNDAELIRMELKRGGLVFSSVCAETQKQFTEQIKTFKPDIILSDYKLPGFDGIAALKISKELSPETPFIIVTGTLDEETAAETIQAGAADYVVKEHLARLLPAIKRVFEKKIIMDEARRVEENLKRSEERHRFLYENNPTMYFTLDSEGIVLSVNKFGAEQLGYQKEELVGQSVFKVFYEDDKKQVAKSFKEILSNPQEIAHWEFRKIRKDGSMLHVKEAAHVVRDFTGKTVVLVVCEDVSEQKKVEEQLMEKEEELRQSQKMDAIGQLAGGIAHDFNNLLTAIMGYSDLVLNNLGEDHFLRSDVEEIRKAADRAAALTRQLLAFGRKQMLEPRVLDLNGTVFNMDKMLRRLIGENLDLNIVLEPHLWPAKLDPAQMEQVLVNLTVNSRDAMPNGGQLTVKTSNIELDEVYARQQSGLKPGNYVMLSVDDTGMGMSKETKEHIFEPFFTTKEKGKGTGLGLATVYGVVKQTGGHISVYSEIGKGTSFKIYFPRVEEAVKEEISHEPVIQPKSARGSETILLVEDEGIVRKLAKELLEMSGYKVLAAKDADEAIKISGEHKGPIHLLMTDIVIPKMDGRELSKKIISKRPDIKVLFISGYTENSVLHQGILDPGVAFLQKPFTADGVTSKVREVLESSLKSTAHKRAA